MARGVHAALHLGQLFWETRQALADADQAQIHCLQFDESFQVGVHLQGHSNTGACLHRDWAGREPLVGLSNMKDGEITGLLFEILAEPHLIQPTILYDFPTDISPLSKCRTDDPTLAERFEIYVAGMELANAFSELNDPIEQEKRFREQVEAGGEEAPREVDMDYIRALAHGMPPAAGEGIGIDRLTMLFTDSHSIREVILFPLLRPEAAGHSTAAEEAGAAEPNPGEKK